MFRVWLGLETLAWAWLGRALASNSSSQSQSHRRGLGLAWLGLKPWLATKILLLIGRVKRNPESPWWSQSDGTTSTPQYLHARAQALGFGFGDLKPMPTPASSQQFGLAWLVDNNFRFYFSCPLGRGTRLYLSHIKKKSAKNTVSVDAPTSLHLEKRGKCDIARDNEKPRFIDATTLQQTSGARPEDGKVTLKLQHSRVERTVQLGIDFYLGYYLFKLAFPGTEQKNTFAGIGQYNKVSLSASNKGLAVTNLMKVSNPLSMHSLTK
ncbi:hypothetical protein B0H14DRAFT_2575616 [Mycena olivaceomarginata]|nr:hypothetical protein B0H14DRAFT_2575616 [Mycena olivaceomarginata]